jgi:tRNA(Ile)-lysidine synthetase-like protein
VRNRALLAALSLLEAERAGRGRAPRPEGRRLSARLARAALEAVEAGGLYRGAGIELRREGGNLILSRSLDFPKRRGYFVVIDRPGPGGAEIHLGSLAIAVRWSEGPEAAGVDEAAFSFPLVVRSRRPGDALSLRRGRKPLDELLSEWGLPAEARGSLPVIEDRDGIVAVLGSAWGGRDRFRHCGGGLGNGRKLSIAVKGALA